MKQSRLGCINWGRNNQHLKILDGSTLGLINWGRIDQHLKIGDGTTTVLVAKRLGTGSTEAVSTIICIHATSNVLLTFLYTDGMG
jgi:hypothetical protein